LCWEVFSNVNNYLQLSLKSCGRCRNSTVWCFYSPASFNGKSGFLSMVLSAAFVYTSLLVVMVVCKHGFNALTILPCGRQCNAKTCIWYQEHLQSPTAHLSSRNSRSKLSISPLITYVGDLVSLPVLLTVHTSSVSYHSYQKGERTEPVNLLSKWCTFSSLFSRLSLFTYFTTIVSSISFLIVVCLSLCRCLTGLYPSILHDLWLQNGKTVLVMFSSFAPRLKKTVSLTVGGFHLSFRETNPCRDMVSTCSWQVPQGRQGVGH